MKEFYDHICLLTEQAKYDPKEEINKISSAIENIFTKIASNFCDIAEFCAIEKKNQAILLLYADYKIHALLFDEEIEKKCIENDIVPLRKRLRDYFEPFDLFVENVFPDIWAIIARWRDT